MENPLAVNSKRFPAGDENMKLGEMVPEALGEFGHGVGEMLATVQNQERALAPQMGEKQCFRRLPAGCHANGSCQGRYDEAGIPDLGKVQKELGSKITSEKPMCGGECNGCLAQAAGADDADEPARCQQLADIGDLRFPTDDA